VIVEIRNIPEIRNTPESRECDSGDENYSGIFRYNSLQQHELITDCSNQSCREHTNNMHFSFICIQMFEVK